MTPGWNRAVGLLFWLAAVACPLDLLQYIPGLGISFLSLVALLLLPALLLDAIAQQKLRVPFELLAPAAVVLVLTGTDAALHGPREQTGEIVSGLVLFVAVTHFSPSRDLTRRYVFAFVLSGFAVTMITLISQLVDWMPTAFSARSDITFTFAYTVPSAIYILLLVAAAANYVAGESRFRPTERAAATGAIVFLVCGLVATAIFWAVQTAAPPVAPYRTLSAIQFTALGVTLWLATRLLAKIVVDARSGFDRLHRLWLLSGLVTIVVCACAPVPPGAYQGYLAGLAAATVLPSRFVLIPSRLFLSFALVPAILAVTNLLLVSPANTRDHRQYDAASALDFDAGRYGRVLRRLDVIERHAPYERRTHLWRARTALAMGLPNWASFEYARSIEPLTGATLLGPPTDAERKDFVVQMRDAVAGMSELKSVCAFERTLLAEGDRDAALFSLRLETAVALTHVEDPDTSPFAAAVANVMGDPSLISELELWSAEELVTLLSYWGAALDESVGDSGHLILVAQRSLSGLDVFVDAAGREHTLHEDLAPPESTNAADLTSAGKMFWSASESEPNTYILNVEFEAGSQTVGTLSFRRNGTARFELVDSAPPIPFTPAIRIRLDS